MPILVGEKYLKMLGEVLVQQGIIGEILLTERGVFLLDIQNREVSKDIMAYFSSGEALRKAALFLAKSEGLSPDWLEEVLASNFPGRTSSDGATYPGLHIYVAPPGYVFTMSLLFGSQSDDQVYSLAVRMGLSTIAEVDALIRAYLPEQVLPSQVRGRIERIWGDINISVH